MGERWVRPFSRPFTFSLSAHERGSLTLSPSITPLSLSLFFLRARGHSVPRQCVQDAYNIATGCSSDVIALAEQEREAVLSRVGVNPLMYFQPTSWSVLSALNETVNGYAANGVNWRVGQTCCDHLSSLTAGGCLCDPDIVSFLASITGQGFLDALRTTYSNSCVSNGTLALYPSADC